MKNPKLKYYYMAMPGLDYDQFCLDRRIEPRGRTTVNTATGTVTTTAAQVYLYATAWIADTRFRQINSWLLPLYVLRIPADLINRHRLQSAPDPAGMWILSDDITVPHCGVERFEIGVPDAPEIMAQSP